MGTTCALVAGAEHNGEHGFHRSSPLRSSYSTQANSVLRWPRVSTSRPLVRGSSNMSPPPFSVLGLNVEAGPCHWQWRDSSGVFLTADQAMWRVRRCHPPRWRISLRVHCVGCGERVSFTLLACDCRGRESHRREIWRRVRRASYGERALFDTPRWTVLRPVISSPANIEACSSRTLWREPSVTLYARQY